MQELFRKRTLMHIELVGKNLMKFDSYQGLCLSDLKQRAMEHDLSKFSDEEIEGYTWLTWNYHCKANNIPFELNSKMSEVIGLSLKTHAHRNLHHPEAHADVNNMGLLDIVEMIADWTAVAQENGRTSCREWALENLSKKWNFSQEKLDLIFEVINELDLRNAQ